MGIEKKGKIPVFHHDSIEVLVNKSQPLPMDYAPKDLTIPDIPFTFEENLPKRLMRKEAAQALEKLFKAAKYDGLQLAGVSAYRSYARQEAVFNHNVKIKGEAEAEWVSARPGESEHQTGLAIDVSCPTVGYELSEDFGQTKEGKWLSKNAHKYGFIIRYPQGKEEITEYQYEPWHLRYVGPRIALEIIKNNLTLEEYYYT